MFGGVSKEDYDKAVKATNELRVKLEKLRLENTLLKDQIRALKKLPPEESQIYVYIQTEDSVTLEDIFQKFDSKKREKIIKSLESLLQKKYLELMEKDGKEYYSVATADLSGGTIKRP